VEVREAIGDKFPKHIYHSIVCIGALIAACRCMPVPDILCHIYPMAIVPVCADRQSRPRQHVRTLAPQAVLQLRIVEAVKSLRAA
jgi:hypothetical protein